MKLTANRPKKVGSLGSNCLLARLSREGFPEQMFSDICTIFTCFLIFRRLN